MLKFATLILSLAATSSAAPAVIADVTFDSGLYTYVCHLTLRAQSEIRFFRPDNGPGVTSDADFQVTTGYAPRSGEYHLTFVDNGTNPGAEWGPIAIPDYDGSLIEGVFPPLPIVPAAVPEPSLLLPLGVVLALAVRYSKSACAACSD